MSAIQNIAQGQALFKTLQPVPKLYFIESKNLFPSILSFDSTFPAKIHPQIWPSFFRQPNSGVK